MPGKVTLPYSVWILKLFGKKVKQWGFMLGKVHYYLFICSQTLVREIENSLRMVRLVANHLHLAPENLNAWLWICD
jgi:hypothetical protein